jgi:glyoxylase-like metal-dependent hydrolase (beta-lactamase superfamily II)
VASLGNRRETQVRDPVAVRLGELAHEERDSVLVGTFLSAQHSRELLDWVVESGKNLVTIYVTHAHGDHCLGPKLLLDRFPKAKAVATAPVVAAIQDQIKPDFVKSFWEPRFPDNFRRD